MSDMELLPATAFGRALGQGVLKTPNPELVEHLDENHLGDTKIAKAARAVDEYDGMVVDLARVAGMLSLRFAVAPASAVGKTVTRRRDISDGEMEFSLSGVALPKRRLRKGRVVGGWSMRFEPGVVHGGENYADRSSWRISTAIVPPIPAQHRPADTTNHFIVWEQEWAEKILRPRDPALLEWVVGDVYVVKAVWDLTELEAAALRGRR